MGMYLWEGESLGVQIMRCKGRYKGIESDGQTAIFMLQGVGDLFELREMKDEQIVEGDESQMQAKFLFVGRGIDVNKVKAEIQECIKTS